MAILKSAVVLGNANINGTTRILRDLTLDSGIISSLNASDTKFWNTNGGIKTASEIVGAGLTMKDDNIQLTGSQLGLNSVLTGIGTISGSLVKISGDSSGSGAGVNIAGKEIVLTGNEVTISTTSGQGSTIINFENGSVYFGSGSAVITAYYKTVISNNASDRVEVGSGSVYISATGSNGSITLMSNGTSGKATIYSKQITLSGSTTLIDGASIRIGSGTSSGSASPNGISITGGGVMVGSAGTQNVCINGGYVCIGSGAWSGAYPYGPSIMITGGGVDIGGQSAPGYAKLSGNGLWLTASSGHGSINLSGNLLLYGYYQHSIQGSSLYVGCTGSSSGITMYSSGTNGFFTAYAIGSASLTCGTGSLTLSSTSGTAQLSGSIVSINSTNGSGSLTIQANSGGAIYINNPGSATGSLNIGTGTNTNATTYLWGSVIARNNGIKLATSGSTVGCTMTYDTTEECVKFTF